MKKDSSRAAMQAAPKAKPPLKKGRFDGLPPSCTPVILASARARGRK